MEIILSCMKAGGFCHGSCVSALGYLFIRRAGLMDWGIFLLLKTRGFIQRKGWGGMLYWQPIMTAMSK